MEKIKIFIVEDDTFIGGMISERLTGEGMEVKLFTHAEEALKVLENEVPHLIILDIFLPGMNGLKALEVIRQDSKLKDVPVLVVSNTNQQQDRDKVKELNAKFMVKALVTPDSILEKIKEFLGMVRLNKV